MRLKNIWLLVLPLLMIQVSCKKWTDVQPKVQFDAESLYATERGYKDVLTYVYLKLVDPAMYGKEMTYGFVDVIGQAYTGTGTDLLLGYALAKRYDYKAQSVNINYITPAWSTSYSAMANLNSLIEHLRDADRGLFAKDNYNVLLGEALGLRAMLHFDLLRLFGPSYKSNPSAISIPYVNKSGFKITPFGTVSEVMGLVLTDLQEAASLLKSSDPIVTNRMVTVLDDEGYLMKRNFHFNYYAARALMARVYLYKADYENAAICADEIINSGKFNWTSTDAITTNDLARDRTFSTEQVFVLDDQLLPQYINQVVPVTITIPLSNGLSNTTSSLNQLYPEASDWRKIYLWTAEGFAGARYCTKLVQPDGMPALLARRLPIIRLPELYLISAEAALATNPSKAITRLRELRTHRGMPAGIADDTPTSALLSEILKEYKREFIMEGVVFYQYKRLDASSVDGVTGSFNKANYVLPIPIGGELENR